MADIQCPSCRKGFKHLEKGRTMDGRRCYRCKRCGMEWSQGMQGRERSYVPQRQGFQFHDTGASKL